MPVTDLLVIGGGAAGFFGAIRYAELHPGHTVVIIEKSARTLDKVRISGGGRCNVTHGCFDPSELVGHYPRGERELLGPFHTFMCGDMMGWLADRGVETKIEADGRVFPVTDQSASIIDCFHREVNRLGIEVRTGEALADFTPGDGTFRVTTTKGEHQAYRMLIAGGSSVKLWSLLAEKGIALVEPVPSLFTFNVRHPLIDPLMGLSVEHAELRILGTRLEAEGPLLITHWGLSGPAVLRLSAWGARDLAAVNYRFTLQIDFTGGRGADGFLAQHRNESRKRLVKSTPYPGLPRRLWERMVQQVLSEPKNWADLTRHELEQLVTVLSKFEVQVTGKSTFKDEFVTAGGVALSEINFKTMEHRRVAGLYFAGEVLDIDAVTGGFNFQAAWTTAFIAAGAM